MARLLWILSRHFVMMKSIICQYPVRGCIQVVLRSSFCLNMVFVTINSNSEHKTSRSSPLELLFPIPCLLVTKGHLSLSLSILVLKSPICSSLSVRGMPLSTLASWLLKASLFSSRFVKVGAYTLIIVAKLSLLRSSLIVMIMSLSLTGHGISVSFVTISF